jgi:hypothetical protein
MIDLSALTFIVIHVHVFAVGMCTGGDIYHPLDNQAKIVALKKHKRKHLWFWINHLFSPLILESGWWHSHIKIAWYFGIGFVLFLGYYTIHTPGNDIPSGRYTHINEPAINMFQIMMIMYVGGPRQPLFVFTNVWILFVNIGAICVGDGAFSDTDEINIMEKWTPSTTSAVIIGSSGTWFLLSTYCPNIFSPEDQNLVYFVSMVLFFVTLYRVTGNFRFTTLARPRTMAKFCEDGLMSWNPRPQKKYRETEYKMQ